MIPGYDRSLLMVPGLSSLAYDPRLWSVPSYGRGLSSPAYDPRLMVPGLSSPYDPRLMIPGL
eukprot:1191649-Prorocentrum_minimum.AAC.1